ncbi:hypothetical protein [Dapis sp. BLCC M126]|uniref:hypothetical protein n=1 Tax=Dapis sp. BLCC M126 TaxID=3400189 RepID=UPI003CF87C56
MTFFILTKVNTLDISTSKVPRKRQGNIFIAGVYKSQQVTGERFLQIMLQEDITCHFFL